MASDTDIPGLDKPLSYEPEPRRLLPNLLLDDDRGNYRIFRDRDASTNQLPLTTRREFTMLHIMNATTDKPDWNIKIFDDEIRARWKAEALAAPGKDVSESMAEWCMEELKYKAIRFGETPSGAIKVFNGDVVKSDTAVPLSLKGELQAAVRPLENVPEWEKDWHPGSDGKVLDLVHPSLFPVVYGRTRCLEKGEGFVTVGNCIARCGEGKVLKKQDVGEVGFSADFQWLPCEVDISRDDGQARITSYINNLHPEKYTDLYGIIEKIISASIPLWNSTLAPLAHLWYHKHQPKSVNIKYTLQNIKISPDCRDVIFRIPYYQVKYDPDPEYAYETEGPQPLEGEDEWSDSYRDRRYQWIDDTRRVAMPEPGVFRPLEEPPPFDLRKEFSGSGLQIIVKLANIELTPEKPEYGGGTWHVEGQLNEHICATALYYYSSSNITPSSLAFRQQTGDFTCGKIQYRLWHYDWLSDVFGCTQNGPTIQNIGGVHTREGRLLTFPNILQHQVQPFELVDRTMPGHRKLLALFLVDPNIKIISSANVPCQRKDWWREEIGRGGGFEALLPRELGDLVFERVEDFPMGVEQAKELRLDLMEERKAFVLDQASNFEEEFFSLCEH